MWSVVCAPYLLPADVGRDRHLHLDVVAVLLPAVTPDAVVLLPGGASVTTQIDLGDTGPKNAVPLV